MPGPDHGASNTTLSWVETTDPTTFVNPNPNEATVTFSMTDDISMSGRSDFTTGKNLRLYVCLSSGARILVPMVATATVHQLHAEVVRRAATFGSTVSVEE